MILLREKAITYNSDICFRKCLFTWFPGSITIKTGINLLQASKTSVLNRKKTPKITAQLNVSVINHAWKENDHLFHTDRKEMNIFTNAQILS